LYGVGVVGKSNDTPTPYILTVLLHMAYNREHILLRILGHFGAGATDYKDRWSTGLRLAVVGGAPPATTGLVTFLETVSAAVINFHVSSSSYAGNACWLDELTAAHIGLDGKYATEFTDTVHHEILPAVGGAGASHLPWNTAHVISVRTLKPRGVASNGRMYYPCLAAPVDTYSGRVVESNVDIRLSAAKVMFDAINTAAQTASSGLRIHVLSKKGSGWSALATGIRADGRLDSIERRENQIPTTWTNKTLA